MHRGKFRWMTDYEENSVDIDRNRSVCIGIDHIHYGSFFQKQGADISGQ